MTQVPAQRPSAVPVVPGDASTPDSPAAAHTATEAVASVELLAARIRSQAAISTRPGQLAALEAIADEVEAMAGWRPPARVIENSDELDGLPVGTLLLDQWRTRWHRQKSWFPIAVSRADAPMRIVLPGTVLWIPDPEGEQ